MWTWVMNQQHVPFRTHSNVPMSCFTLLPPFCFPHLLWHPPSEVKFFILSFCTSSVLSLPLYLFPLHLTYLLDTKIWESVIRTLLWDIKIWCSCLFCLQNFTSVSLCVQPLEIAQGRNSTSPFACLKLSQTSWKNRGPKNNDNILSECFLSHLGWLKMNWMMRQQWVLQRCWRSTRNWCIYGELHSTEAQALWQSLH